MRCLTPAVRQDSCPNSLCCSHRMSPTRWEQTPEFSEQCKSLFLVQIFHVPMTCRLMDDFEILGSYRDRIFNTSGGDQLIHFALLPRRFLPLPTLLKETLLQAPREDTEDLLFLQVCPKSLQICVIKWISPPLTPILCYTSFFEVEKFQYFLLVEAFQLCNQITHQSSFSQGRSTELPASLSSFISTTELSPGLVSALHLPLEHIFGAECHHWCPSCCIQREILLLQLVTILPNCLISSLIIMAL